MAVRKGAARRASPRNLGCERAKDEVYRQMFLLEEHRPGAEMRLALALLRAWLAVESGSACDEERDWLKKVSPICLHMIEAAFETSGGAHRCTH